MTDPGVLSSFHAEQKWDHVRVVKWRLQQKRATVTPWPCTQQEADLCGEPGLCKSVWTATATLRSTLSSLLNVTCVLVCVSLRGEWTEVWLHICQINPSSEFNKQTELDRKTTGFHLCPHCQILTITAPPMWIFGGRSRFRCLAENINLLKD